jgi:hypothetical protein
VTPKTTAATAIAGKAAPTPTKEAPLPLVEADVVAAGGAVDVAAALVLEKLTERVFGVVAVPVGVIEAAVTKFSSVS